MDLKYLTDAKGTLTGVFIAIEDWRQLQRQYGIGELAAPDSGEQLRQKLAAALPPLSREEPAKK